MRKLEILATAREAFTDIFTYLADQTGDDDVARRAVDRLMERAARLAALPGTLGTARPQLGAGVRSTPHGHYVIFFRYRADLLEIINILHASRDADGYFSAD